MYEENEFRVLEDEFRTSWDAAENYFEANVKANTLYPVPLLRLIRELRALGYDERFRAYFLLFTFVISCSRKPDAPYVQSYIRFFVQPDVILVQSRIGNRAYSFSLHGNTINTELKVLLDLLSTQRIG